MQQPLVRDCLPLLAANLIAADKITKPISGFALYNVTDGIVATDIAGWFARWLLSQKLHFATSRLHIHAEAKNTATKSRRVSRTQLQRASTKIFSAFFVMAPILILAAWMRDWWGLANGISMLFSIWLRHVVIWQNLAALALASDNNEKSSRELVKIFLTLPDGKAVTIYSPRGLIVDCILTTPKPPNPKLYHSVRVC